MLEERVYLLIKIDYASENNNKGNKSENTRHMFDL